MSLEKNESLSTRHISTNLANYESARTGFFTLVVDDLTNLLKPSYTGEAANAQEDDYIANAQEKLTLHVVKCPVPHVHIDTHEYRRGNDVVHFAGIPTWDGGSITVDDLVGLDTKSLLKGLSSLLRFMISVASSTAGFPFFLYFSFSGFIVTSSRS